MNKRQKYKPGDLTKTVKDYLTGKNYVVHSDDGEDHHADAIAAAAILLLADFDLICQMMDVEEEEAKSLVLGSINGYFEAMIRLRNEFGMEH